jgi:MATE family multidrug resistance protein
MPKLAPIRREVPSILALAIPIVAGLGASTLLGVTDSVMLAPLGPLPLAAVGITNAVAIILFAAIYGLLSAMSVRVGAAHGAGQKRRIPALLRNGLALGAIVGMLGVVVMLAAWPLLPWLGQPGEVLAIMFPYWLSIAVLMLPFSLLLVFKATFEAMDRPWLGTGFAFLAVGLNVPLSYALIWGCGPLAGLRWRWRPRGWQRRRLSWACTGARSPVGSRRNRRSSRWPRRCSSFLPAAR